MAEQKIRVGVLFGGRSGEHEISLRSALTVMSAMDPARYEIVPIGIDHEGRWFLENNALKLLAQTTPDLGELSAAISTSPCCHTMIAERWFRLPRRAAWRRSHRKALAGRSM